MKLRFGITPFLNIKPLVYALLNGQIAHPFDLVLGTPSELSEQFKQGALDVSLIPAIEYARTESYHIIPDIAICATGHVKSVLLYHKIPISDIKRVALDDASCTSATLIKILFPRYFNICPEYFRSASPVEDMSDETDAALLIGDQALIHSAQGNHSIDLADVWYTYTGQPFVFAFFAVRAGVDLSDCLDVLYKSKQWGLDHLDYITEKEAPGMGLSFDVCRDYLTRRISYNLENDKLQALRKFYQLAYEDGLINQEASLKFYR